jgi:hypothetical protein
MVLEISREIRVSLISTKRIKKAIIAPAAGGFLIALDRASCALIRWLVLVPLNRHLEHVTQRSTLRPPQGGARSMIVRGVDADG